MESRGRKFYRTLVLFDVLRDINFNEPDLLITRGAAYAFE